MAAFSDAQAWHRSSGEGKNLDEKREGEKTEMR